MSGDDPFLSLSGSDLHAKGKPSVRRIFVVPFATFLFVKTTRLPEFVPLMTFWATDAMPGPVELMTGNDVVLRMKLFALLDREAVALNGPAPDKLFASILVLTKRKDPELEFPGMSPPAAQAAKVGVPPVLLLLMMKFVQPINEIVSVLPTRLRMVAFANTPVAAVMRIKSPEGRVSPVPKAPTEIGAGKVRIRFVVLRFELATRDPETVIPEPADNGSDVSAVRLVAISCGDGVLKI